MELEFQLWRFLLEVFLPYFLFLFIIIIIIVLMRNGSFWVLFEFVYDPRGQGIIIGKRGK